MNRAEAIRALLRAGLEAETGPDTEPEPSHGDISDKLRKGYRLSLLLSYLGIILLGGSLLLVGAVAFGLAPVTSPVPMFAVLMAVPGLAVAIVTIALTFALDVARVYTQSDVTPNLRRLDLRRVVA